MKHHQLSDEAAQNLIVDAVNALWDAWVAGGGLDAVEASLGPTKSEPARSIFDAGWKLGAKQKRLAEQIPGEQRRALQGGVSARRSAPGAATRT